VARVQGLQILHAKCIKSTCVLCSAVAYCCGAVAPCAIAALLGRFLPRLGPLVHSSGPFFFWGFYTRHSGACAASTTMCNCTSVNLEIPASREDARPAMTCVVSYSAAAWNGPRSLSGTAASASARVAKSAATCSNRAPRSRRRSSI
jgi:hypothetical protein